LWIGVVGVALAWLLWRSQVVGDLTGLEVAPGLDDDGLFGRALVMLPVVLQYVRLLFAPHRLSADYNPDFIQPATTWTWAAPCGLRIIVLVTGLGWATRRRMPAVTVAIGWIGATLLIVANVLVPTGVILAERTLYLPSIGAVLLLAVASDLAFRRWPRAAAIGVTAVLAAGVVRTVTRNPVWRSNDTL